MTLIIWLRNLNKIPDPTDFIITPDFNRLTKVSFDSGMKREAKSLESKSQVDIAFDISSKDLQKAIFIRLT